MEEMADSRPHLLVDTSEPPPTPRGTEHLHDADIMNDSKYDSAVLGADDGAADQCRICRVEGSIKEPLFHPCKCSGSIKHVHQDCLMEWLSHSQKKHCELCKTPFRFTKLYSPNMPQTLPNGLFLQHSLLHMARNLATWLRGCLVVTVWLACLPYIIRQVWALLFWFSDGGWPEQYLERVQLSQNSTGTHGEMLKLFQESLAANGTSLRVPSLAAPTSPAAVGVILNKAMPALNSVVRNLNVSGIDPLLVGFLKTVSYGLGISFTANLESPHPDGKAVHHFVMNHSPAARSPSALSEISYLKNLTRYSKINQLIISIAEGWIITIVVVVSFILVFLIREWVVQQQPNINMGAGFNAEINAGEALRQAEAGPIENGGVNGPADNGDIGQRPMARARRAPRPRGIPGHVEDLQGHPPMDQPALNRPAAVRDASTSLVEVQRQLTEEPRMTEEFLAVWRRADGDPQEVLRIIARENRNDDMSYWVNAMHLLLDTSGQRESRVESEVLHIRRDTRTEQVEEPITTDVLSSSPTSSEKGKGKAFEDLPESQPDFSGDLLPGLHQPGETADWHVDNSASFSSPSFATNNARPRATSEGPQVRSSISPLVNNTWSFNNLSENEEDADSASVNMASANTNTGADDDYSSREKFIETSYELVRELKVLSDKLPQDNLEEAWEQIMGPARSADVNGGGINDSLDDQTNAEETLITENDSNERTTFHDSNTQVLDIQDEDAGSDVGPEENPFAPDAPLPPPRQPDAMGPVEPQGLLANLAEWLWGDVEAAIEQRPDNGTNDEHIVEDLAAEAPFVPVAHNDPFGQIGNVGNQAQDQEVIEAAIAAGLDPNEQNDPEAEDAAEDFEGIMELIGMRGPIISLVQNALFSALLLALTVFFGVWIPYNIGRATVLLAANPGATFKLPLRLLFWCAALVQDLAVVSLGVAFHSITIIVSWVSSLVIPSISLSSGLKWGSWSYRLSREALERIANATFGELIHFSDSDIFVFSAASHEALLTIQYLVTDTLETIGSSVAFVFTGDYQITVGNFLSLVSQVLKNEWHTISKVPAYLAKPDSWVISLGVAKRVSPLDLELSVWGGWDRFWAIFGGYTALCLLGAAYVKKGAPFSSSQAGREWEAYLVDLLNQAGGVMKVILIISIEMLVFPLYCGLLLDAALLPLFENATLMSRIMFTFASPLTSIFIHWFVGTCYMFHFALFVSMCRKIMRKGVLYFIRDPDDPTFHPVRDVLERNVATQLRKILFSALVYGALVVICLGGVVWGLSYSFEGVLPIHWSSNEPVLEFPIDLLFYNFLMPLAVKFFRPADGLHVVYAWWFRQCARILRLTWFMFDERKEDEEGHVVRRTMKDFLQGFMGEPLAVLAVDDPNLPFIKDAELKAYIQRDGRYVRAPASDQVRVKKGTPIFLQVDEQNNRVPGQLPSPLRDADWDSDLYKQVYIPPHFRMRIFGFILLIWLFAAITGVSITIVPLVLGRYIFGKIIPQTIRKNDVYAFSIGIYILGSAVYAIVHARHFIRYLRSCFSLNAETPTNILRHSSAITSRAARIAWTYSAILFVLPTLVAFLVEFYAILPLHTYFSPKETHTIHFVQSWTLGLLYVKLVTRVIHFYPDSRPAASLRIILQEGYLNPNAGLATRFFIVPASLGLVTALAFPWLIANLAVLTVLKNASEHNKMLAFRFVYPAVLGLACLLYTVYLGIRAVAGWKMRIKDEVYLIGERLHNFGERKVASPNAVNSGSLSVRRLDT